MAIPGRKGTVTPVKRPTKKKATPYPKKGTKPRRMR